MFLYLTRSTGQLKSKRLQLWSQERKNTCIFFSPTQGAEQQDTPTNINHIYYHMLRTGWTLCRQIKLQKCKPWVSPPFELCSWLGLSHCSNQAEPPWWRRNFTELSLIHSKENLLALCSRMPEYRFRRDGDLYFWLHPDSHSTYFEDWGARRFTQINKWINRQDEKEGG